MKIKTLKTNKILFAIILYAVFAVLILSAVALVILLPTCQKPAGGMKHDTAVPQETETMESFAVSGIVPTGEIAEAWLNGRIETEDLAVRIREKQENAALGEYMTLEEVEPWPSDIFEEDFRFIRLEDLLQTDPDLPIIPAGEDDLIVIRKQQYRETQIFAYTLFSLIRSSGGSDSACWHASESMFVGQALSYTDVSHLTAGMPMTEVKGVYPLLGDCPFLNSVIYIPVKEGVLNIVMKRIDGERIIYTDSLKIEDHEIAEVFLTPYHVEESKIPDMIRMGYGGAINVACMKVEYILLPE